MTDRNWEAELAKIDKQLASVSDEALLAERAPVTAAKGVQPTKGAAPAKAVQPAAAPARAPATTATATGTWRGWIQVLLAVGAAAGLMFWPWPGRCGWLLIGFTAASGAVAVLGTWSAVGTWRHRLGIAHVASRMVIVWGLLLGAREVLPRIGYAMPTADRGAGWACEVGSTAPTIQTTPSQTTPPTSPPTTPPTVTTPGAPQG